MRYKKIIFLLCAVLLLTCNACKDNLFDFDLDHIEADGEWGIPVFKGTISLNQLLSNMDSVEYIQTGDDGVLKFIFEKEVPNLVSMSQIFNIGNKTIDTAGIYEIDHLPSFTMSEVMQFNLNTEEAVLKEAVIKSGTLSMFFKIEAPNFTYSATLTTNNIKDAQGNPMSMSFSNNQYQQNINLSNYEIRTDGDGNINIAADVTVTTTEDVTQISYESHISLSNFVIQSITGRFKAISLALDESIGFTLPVDNLFMDNLNLNNAKVNLFAKNDICAVVGSINQLFLYNHQNEFYHLITSPLQFNIPVSPSQYVSIAEPIQTSIQYRPSLDSIKFQCNMNINPNGFNAGDIYVDENSSLDLKVKAELPANLTIDNAVYTDTIENGLYMAIDPSNIQDIEKLTLRIAFTSNFPFDMIPVITFWDSYTGSKYNLNMNNLQIHGSYNNIPYTQEPIFIEVTSRDAQKIVNYDKIILHFRIDTQGNTVEIKDSQFIRAAIGAKVKYSNIHF